MPIPVLLAGVGVAATAIGAGGHICAKETNEKATEVSEKAKRIYDEEKDKLDESKKCAEEALISLGYEKKNVLNSSMKRFLNSYEKIKSVKMKESVGLEELSKFSITQEDALQLKEMTNVYSGAIKRGAAGAATGAIVALAASGSLSIVTSGLSMAGMCLSLGEVGAAASIAGSSLSFGAAMTPIAAIAAPVVLFTGVSASIKADENLEKANVMYAEAMAAVEKMKVSETMCNAIRDRSKMYNELLTELDTMFAECAYLLDEVIYRRDRLVKKTMTTQDFTEEEVRLIAVTRALAGAVKAIIDTPILSKEGEITKESEEVHNETKKQLPGFSSSVSTVKEIDYSAIYDEQDKMFILEKKEEYEQICANLSGYSCEELWELIQEIQLYSEPELFDCADRVINELRIQEEYEKAELLDAIEVAEFYELDVLYSETQKKCYSKEFKKVTKDAINHRKQVCEKKELDLIVENIDSYTREELIDIGKKIHKMSISSELITEYTKKVTLQYDLVEEKQLRELCEGIDKKEIEELKELEIAIGNGNYQLKYAQKYFEMIHSRIEYIHIRQMEMYCKEIPFADREKISYIRECIDEEECSQEIKKKYYTLIEQKEEDLDFEELVELTSDLFEKSVLEIENLYQELINGEYNPKFIKRFILQVRVALENAQHKVVVDELKSIESLNKKQIYDLEYKIKQCDYPERITRKAFELISNKIDILDLYELIDMQNDFDSLSLFETSHLRSVIKQKDISQRSRDIYLTKIREREIAIAFSQASQFVSYIASVIGQKTLSNTNLVLPIYSNEYMEAYSKFVEKNGIEDLSNIPILIYPKCSMLAMTKTDLYCIVNSEYRKIPFDSIRGFSVEKKLLSDMLVLNYSNGNKLGFLDGINKSNSLHLAELFNIILRDVNNRSIYQAYKVYENSVVGFDKSEYKLLNTSAELSITDVFDNFIKKYLLLESCYGRSPSIKHCKMDKWNNTESKVKAGFGINNNDSLVMYYDRTLLNSAKEGVAFGIKNIYFKEHNNLDVIPCSEIYEINYSSNHIIVSTIKNNVYNLSIKFLKPEFERDFVGVLDEYIKSVQLLDSISIQLNDSIECSYTYQSLEELSNKENADRLEIDNDIQITVKAANFCFNCGNKLQENARFCSNCGTKLM
ncbi:MAG: zinc ribbon domain-containing protein [Lachnospiraceae bacterium]|nr:zinc ribbon domain-containing protein [Lachnospiraceae bacterium]